ncbi:MAG: DUF4410 domain-containing protein [Acidobacteria bacterium]|nr:DUF4410 domain-containing protein [Acidobacteriota bacterium]
MPIFSCPQKLRFYALALCLCCLTSAAEAQTQTGKFLSKYGSIVVEAVTLDKNPAVDKFPAGQDSEFQKKLVADLRRKNVFPEVIDGTKQSGEGEPIANVSTEGPRLILSTTIIDYKPGNKALRYTIGFGAGATKVKARFVFRDAATGNDVWVHTHQGVFAGYITVIGPGKNHPASEASGDIVDGLIKSINKYR